MKKLLYSLLTMFLAFVLIACDSKTTTKKYELPEISSVSNFASYDDLKGYLDQFYEENEGYYTLKGGMRFFTTNMMVDGMLESSVTDTTTSTNSGYSQTNTQVEGVDESDTVITDGEYIYLVTMGRFVIINAESLQIVYTYTEEDLYIDKMYIEENRVVLLGSQYTYTPVEETDDKVSEDYYYFHYYYEYGVKVVILDIEDKAAIEIAKELYFDQSYLTESRMINGQLYLIMNNYFVNYGYLEDNFVPLYQDSTVSEGEITLPAENIYYMPNDNYSISYLLIASLNIYDEEAAQVDAYIGSTYQIYMSLNNLYSVVYRSAFDEETGYYTYNTYVLRFEIIDGKLVYQAMGGVTGSPLNQFSMDEYNGTFRIATTDWSWNNDSQTIQNQLFILDATSIDEMTFISVLGGLGKVGERIYAVRFSGVTAYVVTFVQTDPLYKLDLSNPLEPKIVGELHENGVSDYLHQMSDDLLIGVGRQADSEGRFQGVKISLYDTTGNNPENIDTYLVEGTYSYTPVTYDHKMFVYYQPEGQDYWYVAIPVFEYDVVVGTYEYRYVQNLYVFKITLEGDLELAAKLPVFNQNQYYESYYYDYLLRGLFINDYVYSITYRSVKQYDMTDGFKELNSVVFVPQE
ncbi:MAG: hypothetical protein CVV56_05310 [Tenericutes bacterium HGW-Tenericutes-1]|jgi:uncharacterized secreted protein with C-terminal beta-propeller domain|nr:MAG: hypothetical protein CVV56_05310 [Tenericutes bacterium HGW-Tenericutes-1]